MTLQIKYQTWLVSNTTLGRNWRIIANLTQIPIKFHFLSFKVQRQLWDILQGVSSLGVKFTTKILDWFDK